MPPKNKDTGTEKRGIANLNTNSSENGNLKRLKTKGMSRIIGEDEQGRNRQGEHRVSQHTLNRIESNPHYTIDSLASPLLIKEEFDFLPRDKFTDSEKERVQKYNDVVRKWLRDKEE